MVRARTRAQYIPLVVLLGTIIAAGCRPGTPIREAVRPSPPYEQYAQSLRDARLEETALGRECV